ncbi:MAG TPA: M50 family metallopeptidase [Anaerolineales bacterium]|nr:M50 family metallopeptidase [Anaerolineales bacterium]
MDNGLLLFIGAIVLLIIIHEFGHFLAAKLFGVEVEEFGLGFPPRAVKLFTFGGTIYSLNWIPLGGFVRPKGENDPTVPGGLAAANPWVRIAVFAAGPLANFLAAIILFAVIFVRAGVPDISQILIIGVDENSPAAMAGLQPGDIITEMNNDPITSPEKLQRAVAQNTGKEALITYLRGDQTGQTTLTPRENPPPGEGSMGILYSHPTVQVGAFQAIGMGSVALYDQVMQILTLPGRVIQGTIAPENARLVGYKGMYDIYQGFREADVAATVEEEPSAGLNTLYFFASISISLGLLNLFPIPALDGGRIMFALPEIIFRKRIPQNAENIINFVSFALLLLLMLYINVQDFVNPADF